MTDNGIQSILPSGGVESSIQQEGLVRKRIFPLKHTSLYEHLKTRGEIVSVPYENLENFETTRFMIQWPEMFERNKQRVRQELDMIKKERFYQQRLVAHPFKPIKQSRNDNEARTCTIATAANTIRALMGSDVTELDLVNQIPTDVYSNSGNVPLEIAVEMLTERYGFESKSIRMYEPAQLIEAIENGFVINATWGDHARLISGCTSGPDGMVQLIINDPMSDEPEASLIDLDEFSAIWFSWDNLTLTAYRNPIEKMDEQQVE